MKSWLTEKYSDTGKDRKQKEKGVSSISNLLDMNLSKTPGDCEVQGCLVCCSSWGCKGINQEHHHLASDIGLSVTESKFCSPPDGLMSQR